MDTAEAARRFVRVWRRAWAAHDVDAILELYAEDCVHRSMPFREPHRGRDELARHLRRSFAGERVDDVRFSEPVIGQDGLAVAEFRVLSEENEEPRTLAGSVFVRFDAAGMAVATRDYWHTLPGHTEPAPPMFLLQGLPHGFPPIRPVGMFGEPGRPPSGRPMVEGAWLRCGVAARRGSRPCGARSRRTSATVPRWGRRSR